MTSAGCGSSSRKTRPKKLVVERDLETAVMKETNEKLVSVPARRVTYATERGVSQRRVCTLIKVGRSHISPARRSRTGRDCYRRIRMFLEPEPINPHRHWRKGAATARPHGNAGRLLGIA